MKCPYCGFTEDKVIDSRESKDADSIRRRRECERCNKRFTTYERLDEIPYMVVKKDGRRENFDRQKVLTGLLHSCQKRKVSKTSTPSPTSASPASIVTSRTSTSSRSNSRACSMVKMTATNVSSR